MRTSTWFLLGIVLVLLLAGGGTAVYVKTRGLRNNNPGNIRHGKSQWLGMAKEQTDPDFVQFVSPEYGIRAMASTLRTYRNRYGLKTLRQLVTRWAPPTENDTESYIADVSARAGIAPQQEVRDVDLPRVIAAMIRHENGVNPYQQATIEKGVSLA